jgi:hypothetical protein
VAGKVGIVVSGEQFLVHGPTIVPAWHPSQIGHPPYFGKTAPDLHRMTVATLRCVTMCVSLGIGNHAGNRRRR